MNDQTLDLQSPRARKARLAGKFGPQTLMLLRTGLYGFGFVAVVLFFEHYRLAFDCAAVSLICLMLASWYKHDVLSLPPQGSGLSGRLSGELIGLLDPSVEYSPRSLWHVVAGNWQTKFMLNRFLLPADAIETEVSDNPADLNTIWQGALGMADATHSPTVEPGHIAVSIIFNTPSLEAVFSRMRLTHDDVNNVVGWLMRVLELDSHDRPFFGGIGRDWSNGYTPVLSQFGQNISLQIEAAGGAHFGALSQSQGVEAIVNAFSQGTGGIGLIGESGIGKSSHVSALAQRMLEGKAGPSLEYNQIIALNPSVIISAAQHPGELEHIVLTLLQEAVHAGHIILFLDDAQLFFENGPGSFDMTHILLPAVQSGAVRFIMAMTPTDWQHLRAQNTAFAGLVTPVMLSERSENETLDVLEDTALGFEADHHVLITYEALREAYRLSGRYEQEMAYPGKAINLLRQGLSHANNGLVNAESIQKAIEQTRGVKVSNAQGAEADTLLHLEDLIHQRMINQTRAVSVVAAALRRARAGVASPKRPIGSFLFLGPTGVGKTELAKAIAATYFGSESNMVRLDMSEYQQDSDVSRLLSAGENDRSLILAVRQQPFSVVLLDEIEKAHPNILNLLLQMLDEGSLTDVNGRPASFRDCVIIATSNAGANTIRERIEQGQELADFESELTDQLINSGQFKPELLNRFDEIVLFRPLKPEELAQVVLLMLDGINQTLKTQNISVDLTPEAVVQIVMRGNDPRLGARPMRRMLQRAVEDGIAGKILRNETKPGDHIVMDVPDLSLPGQ